jgi:hypothetical protein
MNEDPPDAAGEAAAVNAPEKPEKKRRPYRPIERQRPEDWRPDDHSPWASREEVASYEGVSVSVVDAQLDRGDITGIKIGDLVRINVDSVFCYLAGLPARPRKERPARQPRAPGAPKGKPGRKPKPRDLPPSESDKTDTGRAAS